MGGYTGVFKYNLKICQLSWYAPLIQVLGRQRLVDFVILEPASYTQEVSDRPRYTGRSCFKNFKKEGKKDSYAKCQVSLISFLNT